MSTPTGESPPTHTYADVLEVVGCPEHYTKPRHYCVTHTATVCPSRVAALEKLREQGPPTLHFRRLLDLVLALLLDPCTVAGDADSAIADRLNPLRALVGLPVRGSYGLSKPTQDRLLGIPVASVSAAERKVMAEAVSTTWEGAVASESTRPPFTMPDDVKKALPPTQFTKVEVKPVVIGAEFHTAFQKAIGAIVGTRDADGRAHQREGSTIVLKGVKLKSRSLDALDIIEDNPKPHTAGEEIVRLNEKLRSREGELLGQAGVLINLRADLAALQDAIYGHNELRMRYRRNPGAMQEKALKQAAENRQHRSDLCAQARADAAELLAARNALSAVSYHHHHRDAADMEDTSTEQLIDMAHAAVGVFENDQGLLGVYRDWMGDHVGAPPANEHADRAAMSEMKGQMSEADLTAIKLQDWERWAHQLLPFTPNAGRREKLSARFTTTQDSEREQARWQGWAVEVIPGIVYPNQTDEWLRVRVGALVDVGVAAAGGDDSYATWAAGVLADRAELNRWRDGIRAALAPWLGDDCQEADLAAVLECVGNMINSDARQEVQLKAWKDWGERLTGARFTTYTDMRAALEEGATGEFHAAALEATFELGQWSTWGKSQLHGAASLDVKTPADIRRVLDGQAKFARKQASDAHWNLQGLLKVAFGPNHSIVEGKGFHALLPVVADGMRYHNAPHCILEVVKSPRTSGGVVGELEAMSSKDAAKLGALIGCSVRVVGLPRETGKLSPVEVAQ